MSNFVNDLREAKMVEEAFKKNVLERYFGSRTAVFSEGDELKDWDVKVEHMEGTTTFEIKYDKKASFTGNVAIELSCNGNDSGIIGSKADFIVYYIDKEWYIVNREALVDELLSDKKITVASVRNTKCRVLMGGDGNRAEILLLPMALFKEIFNVF